MSKMSYISSMNMQQPYTSIVINAVGVPSKFSSYVKDTEVKILLEKHDKYIQIHKKYEEIVSKQKMEESECKKSSKQLGKDRKEYYKKELKTLEKEEKSLGLSKTDIMKAENIKSKTKEKVVKSDYLDEWQHTAINMILKGDSLAIFGPTSGGKTYLVKFIVNELKGEKTIVYVSPTFHLALQTYADIQVTYSGFPASLITDKIIDYNKGSNIYVGTAEELLNFFIGNNISIDVGIFDEIHSISLNTFHDISRINATTELLRLSKEQIIALSATVKDEDKSKLITYINETSKKELKNVSYTKRVVPQEFYTFDDKNLGSYSSSSIIKEADISPEKILKLCIKMRTKGMLPSIMFLMVNTYDKFIEFVKYLDSEESREYYRIHQLANEVNESIFEYNGEVADYKERCGSKDLDAVADKQRDGKTSDLQKTEGSLKSKRDSIIKTVMTKLETNISKLVILLDNIQNYETDVVDLSVPKYFVKNTDWIKYIPFKIVNDGEVVDFKEILPTPELVDLCGIYGTYHSQSFDYDNVVELPIIPETKGSYFNFGNSNDHVLTSFINKHTKQNTKVKNLILNMAKAEGLEEENITKFINVISKGLLFGISALLKEFPFFIQYQIMELMKLKKLGLVFANEGMSMGINYPLKSVIIGSSTQVNYPVTNLLQMAGRCGRRGLDTVAHVVGWGIKNMSDIVTQNIETLELSDTTYVLNKPLSIEEFINNTNDRNILQQIYLRYHTFFSKEESLKLKNKYKLICENEYKLKYC